MNYFQDSTTAEEIKKTYRQWATKLHPDVGGSTEQMQELNKQYEIALKNCNGQQTIGADGKSRTYKYYPELENQIVEKIDQLLRQKLEGCDIWLIGLWIWIKGNTKPYKEQLKGLGCLWSSKHTSWYWRPEEARSCRSGKGLAEIAMIYGAEKITQKDEEKKATQILS